MKPIFCGLVICLITGCGAASDAPPMAKVSGVANFDGTPLPEATITFYPEKGPPGVGRTDADGKFQIRTNGQLGVAVGKHRVTVGVAAAAAEAPPMDGNEMAVAQKSVLPSKYNDVETTDLRIDVPEAGNSNLVLDLTQ